MIVEGMLESRCIWVECLSSYSRSLLRIWIDVCLGTVQSGEALSREERIAIGVYLLLYLGLRIYL